MGAQEDWNAARAEQDKRKAALNATISSPTSSAAQKAAAADALDKENHTNPLNPDGTAGDPNADASGTRKAQNVGPAVFGGYEGAQNDYKNGALNGMQANDGMQAQNSAAMQSSIAQAMRNRGIVSPENATLVGRENAARAQQGQALELSKQAAMGLAPSAASYAASQGMNDSMAGQAGAMGAARGLNALSGVQGVGGQGTGMQMSSVASQGGMARSKEMSDNLGQYGSAANNMRAGDLSRLSQSDQNAAGNADLNASWQLGNMGMAAKQGNLGNAMAGMDDSWYDAATKPKDQQFQNDQENAASVAGSNAGDAALAIARSREQQDHARQVAGGAAAAGLTAVGSFAGPAGTAAGAGAGGMLNSYINR